MTSEDYTKLFSDMDETEQFDFIFRKGICGFPDEGLINDNNKIPGCSTSIWLIVESAEGKRHIHAWSDSSLVNGVLKILVELNDGCSVRGQIKSEFINEIKETVIYSDVRKNGLRKCIEIIRNA